MVTKTIFIALSALALLSAPVLAQTSGKTSSGPRLSSSDEEFLSEMPVEAFPGADEIGEDADGDGVSDKVTSITDPFAPEEEEKPKVKYVYKPQADMSLRRSIVDTRVGDDDYVQGLLTRGPK